ncbi:hypothetical protein Rrhod_0188 [Rhodococcus rhodnii LMG 5362]|uniref:Maltokinase N-terminal cap domain-containing protein n=1 Tax=Rhodococcus rhodnii LMG 5362 TaxID=1273125 RepID=R7WSW6_9NOCA|nr:hypothetical protein Rrhod_0188 [Rhodococcus rhodnii LMG 5362]
MSGGDRDLTELLASWLPRQRWFAAKGATVTGLRIVLSDTVVDRSDLRVDHLVAEVAFDEIPPQLYQIPIAFRAVVPRGLEPWCLDDVPGDDDPDDAGERRPRPYDAMRDPEAIEAFVRAARPGGPVVVHSADGDVDVHIEGSPRVLGAEQSNTSVVLGESLLLKLFR